MEERFLIVGLRFWFLLSRDHDAPEPKQSIVQPTKPFLLPVKAIKLKH